MFEWIQNNLAWLFSGIGAMLLFSLVAFIREQAWLEKGISADRAFKLTRKLAKEMKDTNFLGDGPPDILVGVSSGGLMITDYLSKQFDSRFPIVALYADVFHHPEAPFSKSDNPLNKNLVPLLSHYNKILVVQDISRTGKTLTDLRKFMDENLPSKKYKIVCLITSRRTFPQPDYYTSLFKNIELRMPFER